MAGDKTDGARGAGRKAMSDNNGWPDPARPGVPLNPERDGWHWLEWMDYCGTKPTGIIDQFKWERDGYWDRTTHRSARYWACWRYLGPCLTPAEVDARFKEARRDALEEAARAMQPMLRSMISRDEAVRIIRALTDTPPGTYVSKAEQERDEFFNRLGRITEDLRLPMDATASRIIEAIRERVDNEREACASVSVHLKVPEGAENWTPLEAWEEALIVFDGAFRDAIRSRALGEKQ